MAQIELNRKWWPQLGPLVDVLTDAVVRAEQQADSTCVTDLPVGTRKAVLSARVRRELAQLPGFAMLPFFGSEYFIVNNAVLMRVKALRADGSTSSFRTRTNMQFESGQPLELFPEFPPLPRVELRYRTDPVTFQVCGLQYAELGVGGVVAEYEFPWQSRVASALEVIELPIDLAPTVTLRPGIAAAKTAVEGVS